MARIVVFNEADPCIAITLEETGPPNVGDFWGMCTECPFAGQWSTQELAVSRAQRHVDGHTPVIPGGDRYSLIR